MLLTRKKILIVGYGFVGQAIEHLFKSTHDVVKVDPKLGTSVDDLDGYVPDFIFVCVNTPSNPDGSCDSSIVEEIVTKLNLKYWAFKEVVTIIKSTITPDAVIKLLNINDKIVINPEFLTQANYLSDIMSSNPIIIGVDDYNIFVQLTSLYRSVYGYNKLPNYIFVSPIEASCIKYSINSFLALKVAYFNELYETFSKLDVRWNNIIDAISYDKRIGSSHMQVPGPDGNFGFGGACFPKDTNALTKFADNANVDMQILKTTINENNRRRNG